MNKIPKGVIRIHLIPYLDLKYLARLALLNKKFLLIIDPNF